MKRQLPTVFGSHFFDKTPLANPKFVELEVDERGNVLNDLDMRSGDEYFVVTKRLHDLTCILKSLPPNMLRELAASRYAQSNGLGVLRPRSDKDDVLTFTRGTRRKTCFLGANHLLGRAPGAEITEGDIRTFIVEYATIMRSLGFDVLKPVVGTVAKAFLERYCRPWQFVTHEGIPTTVLELFLEYGRGANMDTKVLGTVGFEEEKIDQKMSYMSVMSKLDSPVPNMLLGIDWINDGQYSPDDAYGVYIVDCEIDDTRDDTPLYVLSNKCWVPVVGKIERQVVLKPTLDDLYLLQTLNLARNVYIHDSWRFKGRGKRPYRRMYQALLGIRSEAKATSTFFKLVDCAPWGLTLSKFPVTLGDIPVLKASYWYNPVIGYTTVDKMRSINFRTKLMAKGLVSAEVADALYGKKADGWYDEDVYGSKHTGVYTHLTPAFHAALGDDKHNLLKILKDCKGTSISRKVQTRNMWRYLVSYDSDEAIQEWFLREVERTITTRPAKTAKRIFNEDLTKVPLREFLQRPFYGRVPKMEEVSSICAVPDPMTAVLELLEDTVLGEMVAEGVEWL